MIKSLLPIKNLLQPILRKDINKLSFVIGLPLIIAIKFLLIRNSEVLGSPKDSLGYILMATQKIWFPTNNREGLDAALGHRLPKYAFIGVDKK